MDLPRNFPFEHEHIATTLTVAHCGRISHEKYSKRLSVYEKDKRTHWTSVAKRKVAAELASRKCSVAPIENDSISFKRFGSVHECRWREKAQFFAGNEDVPWILCQSGSSLREIFEFFGTDKMDHVFSKCSHIDMETLEERFSSVIYRQEINSSTLSVASHVWRILEIQLLKCSLVTIPPCTMTKGKY